MPQKKKATEKDIQRELEKTTKLLLKIKVNDVSNKPSAIAGAIILAVETPILLSAFNSLFEESLL